MAADSNGSSSDATATRWNSFSNYGNISDDVHDSVVGAIEAQAFIHAMHREEANVPRDMAADASATILGAARRLLTEMRREAGESDEGFYDDILDRWEGENGFISRLANAKLSESSPAFLHEFVEDIHQAAWELGYLKAGRRERDMSELDPVEEQVRQMFE